MAQSLTTAPDAEELLDRLLRRFPQMAPEWSGLEREGSFVRALLEVAARLGRETTRHFDRIPQRDALAFFQALDLPRTPISAATAVTVMTVVEGRATPVLLPRRIEISASGADGDVLFETESAAALTPARLRTLATVDPTTDRIEMAPAAVLATTAGPAPVARRIVAFANTGSTSIQLDPAMGLVEHDLLRIGGATYRVSSADAANGLVTLTDPLETTVADGDEVADVRALEAYHLRDVQRHVFAVGHDDLLNLDQPATITIGLEPADLEAELGELAMTYEVWATRDGEDDPRWHSLPVLGSPGAEIILSKSWPGPIDATEVGGKEHRWVRATAAGPLPARFTSTRASQLTLKVDSRDVEELPIEGSRTVEYAFHNATPLSLSSRFLPFGAEPQRFDTFSIAAPEVLSKDGATATVDVTLVDGSLNAATGPMAGRLYGIGTNGDLQLLRFDDGNLEAWTSLGPAVTAQGEAVPLRATAGLDATTEPYIHRIVALDQKGGFWAAQVPTPTPSRERTAWTALPDLPDGQSSSTFAAVSAASSVNVAVAIGGRLVVLDTANPELGWRETTVDSAGAAPHRIVTLEAAGARLVAAAEMTNDEQPEARLLVGSLSGPSGSYTISWTELEVEAVSVDVSPQVVTFWRPGGPDDPTWHQYQGLAWAEAENRALVIGRWRQDVASLETKHFPEIELRPSSQLAVAAGYGSDFSVAAAWPDVTGNGDGSIESTTGWANVAVVDVPDGAPLDELDPLIEAIPDTIGPIVPATEMTGVLAIVNATFYSNLRLLLGAQTETVLLAELVSSGPPSDSRVDSLVVSPSDGAAHVLEVVGPQDTSVFQPLDNAAISDRDRKARVYDMGATGVVPGTTHRFWRVEEATEERIEAVVAAGADETNAILVGTAVATAADRKSLVIDPDVDLAGAKVEYRNNVAIRIDTTTVLENLDWSYFRNERGYSNPELAWDYFDGDGWRQLDTRFIDGTENLARSGEVRFTVPNDIATTDIGGHDSHWVRARLIGGDYGRPKYISKTVETDEKPGDGESSSVQTITIDTSDLRPPEIASIEVRFSLDAAVEPMAVVVDNNLTVVDQTQANAADTAGFHLFESAGRIAGESERSILLGLTAAPRVQAIPVLADVADQAGSGDLTGQVLTAEGWRDIAVEDHTVGLRRSGQFTLLLDAALANQDTTFRLLGVDGYWIRLGVDRPEGWNPVVRGLYLNAVAARQGRTVTGEVLGSGNGEPRARLALANTPVVPDSLELRVSERITDEEARGLGHPEDREPVVSIAPDRDDSWVLWRQVDSFSGHDGDARVYRLDPAGILTFGDGRNGRILPAGRDNVRAFAYQQGGGQAGNIPAWTELQALTGAESIEEIVLPVAASGGTAGGAEAPLDVLSDRLRHANQALTGADIEALVRAADPTVAQVRCLGPTGPSQPITVAIVTSDEAERFSTPTRSQVDGLAARLAELAWGGLDADGLVVVGPRYVMATVAVDVVAKAGKAAVVADQCLRRLGAFLHPAQGGPEGRGWPFGRPLWASDIMRLLADVDDLDRMVSVTIGSRDTPGAGASDRLTVPARGVVAARFDDLSVNVMPEAFG